MNLHIVKLSGVKAYNFLSTPTSPRMLNTQLVRDDNKIQCEAIDIFFINVRVHLTNLFIMKVKNFFVY